MPKVIQFDAIKRQRAIALQKKRADEALFRANREFRKLAQMKRS